MAKENFFNANIDITQNDWAEIKNELEKGFDSAEDFFRYVFAVKILDPKIEIKIGEKVDEIKEMINNTPVPEISSYEKPNRPPLPPEDDLEKIYLALAVVKIIDHTINLNTTELWKGATESLKEINNLKDNKYFRKIEILVSLAFYMKIFDSSLDINKIIEDAGWKNIENAYSGLRNMDFAAKIKVLNPEIDLKITEDDWETIRGKLLKARSEKNYYVIDGFTPLATTIKILATDNINITENGLEIL